MRPMRPGRTRTIDAPLAEQVRDAFKRRYGDAPRMFRAPGRVNLIGEHTDYNDGFVLPMAIERSTFVAAAPRADRRVEIQSLNLDARAHFDLDGPRSQRSGHWSAYVEGVARVLDDGGMKLRGANLVLASDVPTGAGLSSSAALEMAVGMALLGVSGHVDVDRVQLALAGQKAEHDYVGTKCGIMDQYVSALALRNHALLIDCRSLEAKAVALAIPNHVILVIDSGVKHELASSAYNQRRAECEQGVQLLKPLSPGIHALRDISPEYFARHADVFPEPVLRRVRHVVHENARTLAMVDALEKGELHKAGHLMVASHESLRDDYEVSCKELDVLVEVAMAQPGVVGARMTGGGFGGCTVNLVQEGAVQATIGAVRAEYARRFNKEPHMLVTQAASGAEELE